MVRKKNLNTRFRIKKLPPHTPEVVKEDKPGEVGFPWKGLILAVGFFVIGLVVLLVVALTVSGYSDKYYDRLWPMAAVGMIMFLPGFYHVRIAAYAYMGYPGYSFCDLPYGG